MQPFIFKFTVPVEMIDGLGHVHYNRYRDIAEMAHIQMLAEMGLALKPMLEEGFALVMREDTAVYHHESREGDELELNVSTSVGSIACISFDVSVSCAGRPIANLTYKMMTYSGSNVCPVKNTPFLALIT
jgi:acyl-CoA thioesterase FadM